MNSVLISMSAVMGVAAVAVLVAYLCRRITQKKHQASSDASNTLRTPGQSLLMHIERLDSDVRFSLSAMISGVILFPGCHAALSYFGRFPETIARTFVSAIVAGLFMAIFLWRWMRSRARRQVYRLGLEGELAVAEALSGLTEKGYRIFHDFPADQANISHIVIGPVGVLTVETKAGAIDTARQRKGNAIVNYDGRMLHFPKNSDYQTIDHAKDQAAWLSEWLSEAVGDPISARAIVAIPGWHVKRTSAEGIPVVNPKQFSTLFEHIRPRPLSEDMIQRITQCIARQNVVSEAASDP